MASGKPQEAHGPSYYDVEAFAHQMRARFDVGSLFEVMLPMRYAEASQARSWRVVLKVWRLGTDNQAIRSYGSSFGAGGSWATMPGAMAAAQRDAWDALETEEEQARAQQPPLFSPDLF